jgi:TRAP-type C4-dicarboxylate transport system permease small subunit
MGNPVANVGTGQDRPVPFLLQLWRKLESRLLVNIGVLMFLAATGIMLAEAAARAFFNHSFFWAEEAVRYLFVWVFFLNIGVAGTKGYHIRTGMVVDMLEPKWKMAANSLVCLLGVSFGVILFIASIPHLQRFYKLGMMTESNLDLPLWALFLAVPIGSVLLCLYYLGALWITVTGGDAFDVDHSHDTGDMGDV